MVPPEDDPELTELYKKLAHNVGAALPTSRHASMLFDAVTELLGDAAQLLSWDDGRHRALFRKDAERRDWLVPWPQLEIREGERLQGRFEIETNAEPVFTTEISAPGVRMAGLKRGQIAFGEAPIAVHAEFSDEGMRVVPHTGHGLSHVAAPCDEAEVLARLVNDFAGPGTAVERLAARVAGLDPGRYPARVRWGSGSEGRPDGRWAGCWKPMGVALWTEQVPPTARWLYTGLRTGAVRYTTDAAPPERLGAVVAIEPMRSADAIPPAWQRNGFTRWGRVLHPLGSVTYVLLRGRAPDPVTVVGERLLDTLVPDELDAILDWIHIERDELPLSQGWLPPEEKLPDHMASEGYVLPKYDHAIIVYALNPGGALHRVSHGWGERLKNVGWLDGAWLAAQVVRIVTVG